jgi:hypothetical protein
LENKGETTINFLTDLKCKIEKPGVLNLEGKGFTMQMKYNPSAVEPIIEIKPTDDKRLNSAWDDEVTRISLKMLNKGLAGNISVEFKKLEQ